jgi:hypothetical protein
MLRTLLHDLLDSSTTANPTALELACMRKFRELCRRIDSNEANKLELLSSIFFRTVARLTNESCVVLWVDGLDEYGTNNTERQTLIDLFKRLGTCQNIKICLSSRPWNIFQDAFRQTPSLTMERMSHHDIRQYVKYHFSESVACQELEAIDPERIAALQDEIVSRSRGVFLWVTLVTRRIIIGMQDGATIMTAEKDLESVPEDLEDYFGFILKSIPLAYRNQAIRTYGLMLECAKRELTSLLSNLAFAGIDRDDFAGFASSQASLTATRTRLLGARRFLNSQAMDLVKIVEFPPGEHSLRGLWDDATVHFLHRTVFDFLRTPERQEYLASLITSPFSVNTRLSYSSICMFRSCLPVQEEMYRQCTSVEPEAVWVAWDYATNAFGFIRELSHEGSQQLKIACHVLGILACLVQQVNPHVLTSTYATIGDSIHWIRKSVKLSNPTLALALAFGIDKCAISQLTEAETPLSLSMEYLELPEWHLSSRDADSAWDLLCSLLRYLNFDATMHLNAVVEKIWPDDMSIPHNYDSLSDSGSQRLLSLGVLDGICFSTAGGLVRCFVTVKAMLWFFQMLYGWRDLAEHLESVPVTWSLTTASNTSPNQSNRVSSYNIGDILLRSKRDFPRWSTMRASEQRLNILDFSKAREIRALLNPSLRPAHEATVRTTGRSNVRVSLKRLWGRSAASGT